MLVYFIFSVLACFLFKEIKEGDNIDSLTNFTNFGMSMLLMMRISTGEDWNRIMFDLMRTEDCQPNRCGNKYNWIFFVIYIMISANVMLNLFILVIIQQFETYYLDEGNVLQTFS